MSKLSCSFSLEPSHDRNRRGFKARRTEQLDQQVTLVTATVLGIAVADLTITPTDSGGVLELNASALDETRADLFLDQFEVALTAFLGRTEANAYYGNVVAKFDRSAATFVPDRPKEGNLVMTNGSLGMTLGQRHRVTAADVQGLSYDPLLQLYSDGIRANSPESKFFSWFIILEEFVEKAKNLISVKSLFDPADTAKIQSFAAGFSGRPRDNLLGVLRATQEPRAQKLAAALNNLGIKVISAGGNQISVDEELCATLIKQRNLLFHRGAHIDEDRLYNVLFPVVSELAGRSSQIVALRE